MTFLLVAAGVLIAGLIRQNYQLEKRWRCLRYSWHCMSDFAGERLRDAGEIDEQWREVVREHSTFMAAFGAPMLTKSALLLYEEALVERNIPVLTEHLV